MLSYGLVGNPNCGKTTLFNELTGSTAHVGNWPGVTVDRKEGKYSRGKNEPVNIIDLPGIYSLSPYTPEEIIARNFIINDTPDLIINIVDATNIERNLYLTTQILETDCPVIIALNMMDLVEKEGDIIDIQGLEKALGVKIVPISAAKGTGADELMVAAEAEVLNKRKGRSVLWQSKIGYAIKEVKGYLEEIDINHSVFNSVKLLEGDGIVSNNERLLKYNKVISEIRRNVETNDKYGDIEAIVADLRYKYITGKFVPFIIKKRKIGELSPSEKVDRLLTHKYLGIPIFLIFMFFVFHFTFGESLFGIKGLASPGVLLKGIAEGAMDQIGVGVFNILKSAGASPWVFGLIVDGIIGGVGSVLSFVPQILCLFLFLSILEDSGYMARAAFIMDKILRNFGLSGKSFLPLLMGFGCSVPAIMASRTLENEKDRRITMLIVPFISCGAKLPIYAMFAAALFKNNSDVVIFSMYMLGIVIAIISAIILKKTILKEKLSPFIMELPSYHVPSIKSLGFLLWDKLKDYVIRAGTIILASTIVIWFLSNFAFDFNMVEANSSGSILGTLGGALVPIFKPLGFVSGDNGWRAIVAIITGLIAKEAVVSTMGILYNPNVAGDALGSDEARQALLVTIAATFSPLAAISFMVFNLLCVPCMASVAAMRAEMNSAKWTAFAICFWFCTAWVVSFIIYNVGTILGF